MNHEKKSIFDNEKGANEVYVPDIPTVSSVALDKGSIGNAILGGFFPPLGLILFFLWRESKPQSAKMALTGAAISIGLYILLLIIT